MSPSQGLYLHRTTKHRREADIHTNMFLVGLEVNIFVLERLDSVRAFDDAATVISSVAFVKMHLLRYEKLVIKKTNYSERAPNN
jgi:hypothetical protein